MKLKRNERIGAIVKILTEHPNKTFTLSYFTEKFNTAKSTLSEDVMLVKSVFERMKLGRVITIPGASGGVRYIPDVSKDEVYNFLQTISKKIQSEDRVRPGGFLYLIDIIYDPDIVASIGNIFASVIDYTNVDYLVTIETKGIPMALMTAKAMNIPLLIIRKNSKISEGSSLGITYVSGTSGTVQTMSLPRRNIKEGSRVILIDDFMRGGGTLKGMHDLMKEFKVEVAATGVLISTTKPEEKMIDNYFSLLELDEQSVKNKVWPNEKIINKISENLNL